MDAQNSTFPWPDPPNAHAAPTSSDRRQYTDGGKVGVKSQQSKTGWVKIPYLASFEKHMALSAH